jgi:hypothetical protein
MNAYIICFGNNAIATVEGTECAYAVYRKTAEIAEMLGQSASLVWSASGEVVASTDEEEDDFSDDVDESGFDPYEGCYTFDC